MKDKGTSTEEILEELPELEPNEKLIQFLQENNLDFTALPFTESYVHVPGKGVIIFTSPQLIYKAKVRNG